LSDKSAQDLAQDLIAVLTVGTNFDNDENYVTEVIEDILQGSVEDAVVLLIGVTAFVGGLAEKVGVDLEESIARMALAYAVAPEETLRQYEEEGE
jgi:hypothetical protein